MDFALSLVNSGEELISNFDTVQLEVRYGLIFLSPRRRVSLSAGVTNMEFRTGHDYVVDRRTAL